MTRTMVAWWSVAAMVAVASPATADYPDLDRREGLFVEVVGNSVSAPRISVEHEVMLPREVRVVRVLYIPEADEAGSIEGVTWDGADAEPSTEGYAAKATIVGPGRHEVAVWVKYRLPDRVTGRRRLPEEEYRVVLIGTDVGKDDVHAGIEYPGTRSSPPVDLDGNLKVDDEDLDRFWESYGSTRGETDYANLCDWDGDGSVGLGDLVEFCDSYEGWEGKKAGANYGSGHVYPVTIQREYAFLIPAPLYWASTEPAGFEPWVEWRVEGTLWGTGAAFAHPFESPGRHLVSAGVFGRQEETRDLVVYRVEVPVFAHLGTIQDGLTYAFEARTDPPGYEDYVNWFASTMYGTVTQGYGRGRTFSVRFDQTWGSPEDPSEPSQWLGVQADNDFFNQDQKTPCSVTIQGPECLCLGQTVTYTAFGNPGGGTYEWTIPVGATRASIVGPNNLQTVQIHGDANSAIVADITLQVRYTPPGKASCTNTKRITVASVAIDALPRPNQCDGLPPHKTKDVMVTITPDLSGSHCSFEFGVINGSPTNGTAIVSLGTVRQSSGFIVVLGGDQTAVGGGANLKVHGGLNGVQNCGADSPPFSVCAHPTNFDQTSGIDAGRGVLTFVYAWASDCGHLAHLDQVILGEFVTYPNDGQPPNPPFQWPPFPNPTVISAVATTGTLTDDHLNNQNNTYVMQAGPAAQYTNYQWYRYRCERCVPGGASSDPGELSWGTVLMGPIVIDRFIEQSGGDWRYRITKSSVTATRSPLPITGP